MALRVVSAYCTVSNAAIMVIAGIIPIHLLAMEKAEVEQTRRDGKDLVVEKPARARAMTDRMGPDQDRLLDTQVNNTTDRNVEEQKARTS